MSPETCCQDAKTRPCSCHGTLQVNVCPYCHLATHDTATTTCPHFHMVDSSTNLVYCSFHCFVSVPFLFCSLSVVKSVVVCVER